MKILLFGASGQLGSAITAACAAQADFELIGAPRSVDVADEGAVARLMSKVVPDWAINCAAMTNVDGAHQNPALAMMINGVGPGNIARYADAVGARVIQISTEAVFDGERTAAYVEDNLCRPVAVYGVSKLSGEMLTQLYSPSSIVLRTSWLYSKTSEVNFPTRLLQQLQAHDGPVSVVTDVVGNPTPSDVLAGVVLAIARNVPEPGVYHACCVGAVTKFDWAVEIARGSGYDTKRIAPVNSADYPTAARRPKHVDLNCDKLLATGIYDLPTWKDAWQGQ